MARLYALRDPESGQPIVKEVFRKEEVFQGDKLEDAPDLLFTTMGGAYQCSLDPTDGRLVSSPGHKTGSHRMEGILIATGVGIRKGVRLPEAQLVDLAPTILHTLGCPIPADMEGRVLFEIFEPNYRAKRPFVVSEAPSRRGVERTPMTEEGEEIVRQRLQGLGYLD
jgi:predicted AlkP superfamily phosphohydrolase/phosphomutase